MQRQVYLGHSRRVLDHHPKRRRFRVRRGVDMLLDLDRACPGGVRMPEMEHTALITRARLRRRKKEAMPSLLALERLADRTNKELQLL